MEETKNNELSIVLPVFNEKDVIEKVVSDIYACVSHLVADVEMILVNDGSTDGTEGALERIRCSLPNVKVVSHQKNVGYGGALISGIKAAQKSWILLIDSDGQMQIDSLKAAWPLRQDHDVLLGYREKRADSFYRRMMGKLGNSASNMLLGHHVIDINCGFKIFKRDLIQSLTLLSTGGIINFEILYLIFRRNPSLTWCQYPVTHYPRKVGKSTGGNPRTIFKIIIEGVKILIRPIK